MKQNFSGFRYPPPLYQGEYPKFREISRRKREVQNESYTEDDIYNIDYIEDDIYSIDFSIKITVEGLVSLALVQLPGIALGILGIIKAFINHGCSKQTVIDSLR